MKRPVAIAILALWAASPLLASRLRPLEYTGGFSADDDLVERRNSNAFAVLLGDFRANMSDLMFIKTEQYLHDGMLYTPHLNMDEMTQSGKIEDKRSAPAADDASGTPSAVLAAQEDEHDHDHDGHPDHGPGEHDHDHDHDHDHTDGADHGHDHSDGADHGHSHETVSTIIPPPEADFRGFVGTLQRQVKPWRDPRLGHTHSTGDELLPWYRVMTISSPTNVRAYMIGSWWLKGKRTPEMVEEARRFVKEGIANNPKAYQLHLMLGYIENQEKRFAEARDAFGKAAELALKARPNEGIGPRWTDYQEEDARAAMRLVVFLERRDGDPQKALAMAERFSAAIGGDGRLDAVIEQIRSGAAPTDDHSMGPQK